VDHSVSNRVGGDQSLDRLCGFSTDQVELEAARPCVDDEHVHEGSFA
jgi:hypothetical protein